VEVDDTGVDTLVRGVGVVGVLELPVPGGALLHAPQVSATAANTATAASKGRRGCLMVTSATVRGRRQLDLCVIVGVSG
jgi:hypothetical protein